MLGLGLSAWQVRSLCSATCGGAAPICKDHHALAVSKLGSNCSEILQADKCDAASSVPLLPLPPRRAKPTFLQRGGSCSSLQDYPQHLHHMSLPEGAGGLCGGHGFPLLPPTHWRGTWRGSCVLTLVQAPAP